MLKLVTMVVGSIVLGSLIMGCAVEGEYYEGRGGQYRPSHRRYYERVDYRYGGDRHYSGQRDRYRDYRRYDRCD